MEFMASSYSTDLKLELMVTGENSGTWGDKTNTNLNLIQQAIAGYQSIALTSTNTTLSMTNATISDARNAVIEFTGTLSANSTVYVESGIEKTYTIKNSTTGAFTLALNQVGGSSVIWGTTEKNIKQVYLNGTNANVIDLSTLGGSVNTSAALANSIVTASALDTAAVTSFKVASFAVTSSGLDTSAVTSVKIASFAVTSGALDTASVTSTSCEGVRTASAPIEISIPPIFPHEPYPHDSEPQGKSPGEVTETSILFCPSAVPVVVFNKFVDKSIETSIVTFALFCSELNPEICPHAAEPQVEFPHVVRVPGDVTVTVISATWPS